DAQRGFFNCSSLCLSAVGREREPHHLTLARLPANWQVATAMRPLPAEGQAAQAFESADYDELLDHPFELGTFWRGRFEARGVAHEFIVSGALPVFDGARLLRDAQRICEAQIDFWHAEPGKRKSQKPGEAAPFDRYVFLLNAVDDSYGGLEHRSSTALIASRRDLPQLGQTDLSEGYVRLLGLISHEYFHTWNVKRLKPAEFVAFDYQRENYTELLWFFEGFTSYYDDLFLVRSGLINAPRYLKLLTATLNGVLAAPGRLRQSVAQSSFEAWTKYYRQDENSPNAVVSYYTKGALIALSLDLSLRTQGKAASTLDELMRALWRRQQGGPLAQDDVSAVVTELGGSALAQELLQWVHGTADLPLPALMARAGVAWGSDKAPFAQRLGLRLTEGAAGLVIKQVLHGTPAHAAGLSAGDEILASNDWRIKRAEDIMLTLGGNPHAGVELLVSRDQRVLRLSLQMPAAHHAGAAVTLSLADRPSAPVLSLRKAWLGA
ncbi:MAG: M61 family metallopeptidase, partial [Paucibacter sp.]|nr:M61 family metallopeptidase [Roseateles sp.]